MPTYNRVSAKIHVAGQPLEEYQLQRYDDRNEIVCWIPSHVGKEFSIHVQHTIVGSELMLRVEMDGVCTNAQLISPQRRYAITKCRPSPTTCRSFVFSQGQLVDDDELPVESLDMAGLGTVTVEVYQGKVVGKSQEDVPLESGNIKIPEQRLIPERGKKGIQACVALGPVQSRAPDISHKSLFTRTSLAAKIIFRYRPLTFLQAQGIAPAAPLQNNPPAVIRKRKRRTNPEPRAGPSKTARTSIKHEPTTNSAEIEISDEEDVEKLRALRARIDKALARKDPSKAQVKNEVKKEQDSVFLKGQVIDLT